MPHADLLAALLPPVSYAPSGPHLAASLAMEGRELDRVQADAAHAVGGLRPFLYQQWLEDYERVYGLPGPCALGGQLLQERLALLAVALQERGGISLAWLRRYAALAGYEAKVTEYREFKAGHSALRYVILPAREWTSYAFQSPLGLIIPNFIGGTTFLLQ